LPAHIIKAQAVLSKQQGSLYSALQRYLEETAGITLNAGLWDNILIPPHLKMHFKVIDNDGKILTIGDDLKKIFEDLKGSLPQVFSKEHALERDNIIQWDFEKLPDECIVRKGSLTFTYFPALVDNHHAVSIRLFDSKETASLQHCQGLARLYLLHLTDGCKHFKKRISPVIKKTLSKQYAKFGEYEQLVDEILFNSASALFVQGHEQVRSKTEFTQRLADKRSQFMITCDKALQLSIQILSSYVTQVAKLTTLKDKLFEVACKDISRQLAGLFSPHFIKDVPLMWLKRYPIYLKAIEIRIDKLSRQTSRDLQATADMELINKAYISKLATKDVSMRSQYDPLLGFRWKIEELRVSIFAQELKTLEPVSKIRLLKYLESLD
jgi:ATP-dependent helicase HrpA